jgi:RHS repeat-associated protein
MTKQYDDLLAIEGVHNQRFVWADTLLAVEGANSFYYLLDHLGSPIRLIGDKQETALAYDEFGVSTVVTGVDKHNPFGFTGYQKDNVSGLYYAQARYYHPSIARFVSEDSVHSGANYYVYCHSNPLGFIDLNGLWEKSTHEGRTVQWGLDIGLSPETAKAIAVANNSTDSWGGGKSYMPVIGKQSYHFNTNKTGSDSRQVHADEHLQKAISSGDHKTLGQGLHALQDIQAHGNYGGSLWKSHPTTKGPNRKISMVDDPTYDWADSNRNSVVPVTGGGDGLRILRTELATKDYLTKFILETCV